MAVTKKDLYQLIDQLNDKDTEKVYKVLRSIIKSPKEYTTAEIIDFWKKIDDQKGDNIELSNSEKQQLSQSEYMSWDQLKKDNFPI